MYPKFSQRRHFSVDTFLNYSAHTHVFVVHFPPKNKREFFHRKILFFSTGHCVCVVKNNFGHIYITTPCRRLQDAARELCVEFRGVPRPFYRLSLFLSLSFVFFTFWSEWKCEGRIVMIEHVKRDEKLRLHDFLSCIAWLAPPSLLFFFLRQYLYTHIDNINLR